MAEPNDDVLKGLLEVDEENDIDEPHFSVTSIFRERKKREREFEEIEREYEEIERESEREYEALRAATMDYFGDMEEQGSTMAMDVDDVDPLEIVGDSVLSDNKLADADFFNSFEDDFDDSDIN